MNVLALNAGSSSLKFQLIRTDTERVAHGGEERLARGAVARLGGEAVLTLRSAAGEPVTETAPLPSARAAIEHVLRWLVAPGSGAGIGALADIDAVGHRVVHGGERFTRSTLVTDAVRAELAHTVDLAPLHNPHNLAGIDAARAVLGPSVPQVATFDTAFHHTLPEHAYLYALPYSLYRRHRVRRYGFHGTSHRYLAHRYRELTGTTREATRVVTLHLGNGCSACAIREGASVDTSMGFTPLEGLVMGTRSGDLDPGLINYLAAKEGLTLHHVEALLNTQSGLLGLSGLTADVRDLLGEAEERQDRRAKLALAVYVYRVRKYLGSYLAALNGADAIIFAGGVGENAAPVREAIVTGLDWLGITLDPAANAALAGGREGRFDGPGSRVALWVIPTDEELLIARDTMRVVSGAPLRY
jgi:acetate kinase